MIAPFVELQVGLNRINSTSMPVDRRKKAEFTDCFLGNSKHLDICWQSSTTMEIVNKHGEIKQKQAVVMGIINRPHQHNELGIELNA